jgi:ribosome-associated translation inhibitor RaiA
MQNRMQLTLRGIVRSGTLERYIADEARKLDRVCDGILACHVVAEALHRGNEDGAQFAVRLNITLPGTEVVVNREHGKDVRVAVRDAFEAAGLQLENHMRRLAANGHRSDGGTPGPGG